jgi:hypothetical protein
MPEAQEMNIPLPIDHEAGGNLRRALIRGGLLPRACGNVKNAISARATLLSALGVEQSGHASPQRERKAVALS